MDLGLKGRTALVCASTDGLGWASARLLAAEGVRVAVNGRDEAKAVSKAAELLGNAVGLGGDLTTEEGARRLAKRAVEALEKVDILVLNGPGPAAGKAVGQSAEAMRAALEMLVIAQATIVETLLPPMRDRGWGRVVMISSSSVQAPLANLALSNLGRPAIVSYLKTLASEVAPDGVTLNTVLPGRIDTNRVRQVDRKTAEVKGISAQEVLAESLRTIPTGRLGHPEEIGSAVAYFASEQAAFVTGTVLRVDGGMLPVL